MGLHTLFLRYYLKIEFPILFFLSVKSKPEIVCSVACGCVHVCVYLFAANVTHYLTHHLNISYSHLGLELWPLQGFTVNTFINIYIYTLLIYIYIC